MEPDYSTTESAVVTLSCKNCSNDFSGNFCPACGQKYISKRYTFKDGFSHLFAMVFNVDRGLWYTSKELIRNPGRVIRNYLNGITVPYFHPFRFVFLLITIQVFLMVVTGAYEAVQDYMSIKFTGDHISQLQAELVTGINSYMNILIALSLPILAFGSWAIFRSAKLHYAEHLIITCYAYGETVLVTMIFLLVYAFSEDLYIKFNMLSLPISVAYFTYAYVSFFKGNKILTIIKAIGAYAVWFVGFAVMVSIISVVYTILLVKHNPELLEQIRQGSGA